MKYLENTIITVVFIGVVAGLSTCESNKKSCNIIHPVGAPAPRCEAY